MKTVTATDDDSSVQVDFHAVNAAVAQGDRTHRVSLIFS